MNPVSPKVTTAALVGFLLTALVAGVGALSPETFNQLGVMGPVLFVMLQTLAMSVAAYLKGDPMRREAVVVPVTPVPSGVAVNVADTLDVRTAPQGNSEARPNPGGSDTL